MEAVGIQADLGRVVEEYASCLVAQAVTQAILGTVVDPLLNPDFIISLSRSGVWQLVVSSESWR